MHPKNIQSIISLFIICSLIACGPTEEQKSIEQYIIVSNGHSDSSRFETLEFTAVDEFTKLDSFYILEERLTLKIKQWVDAKKEQIAADKNKIKEIQSKLDKGENITLLLEISKLNMEIKGLANTISSLNKEQYDNTPFEEPALEMQYYNSNSDSIIGNVYQFIYKLNGAKKSNIENYLLNTDGIVLGLIK